MEDLTKNIIFTNAINGQPATIQYQTADGTILKQPKIEGQKPDQQPTFYYTTNGNGGTVNLAQLATTDDNKTCYIAQPVGGYNYALVNGMPLNQGAALGIATVDAQGRIQIVNQNKPIAANTISNISFKCDVCSDMFPHLALLNAHKRMHTEGEQQQQHSAQQSGSESIAVVSAQGLVQAQNIIGNGQMGQIQIVSSDTLEPVQQSVMQQQQHESKSNKCINCGSPLLQQAKRKGSKQSRCESCMQAEQAAQQQQQQQLFVAQDGQMAHPVQIISTTPQAQAQLQQIVAAQTGGTTPKREPSSGSGHHPVKKRSSQQMTKCQKCNGSGVVLVGQHSHAAHSGVGGSVKQSVTVKTECSSCRNPSKPFSCNICGGLFSRYSSLWSHKKLHSGEKNYKCSICGLAFAKAVYLKNHARIHTGEKPYKCQTCGMQFSQSPHLKNHERTHSGERPYVCGVCDKGFARHATLWNHRRIHTGEKPYKCEICGSAFSQAAHLKNHAKVHSGEKPYKCEICSAAFADRFALKRHRGIHQKYGQTAPRQASSDGMIVHKQEIPDMDDEAQQEVIIGGL
ncbi:zinc finger protein 93 isoform X1 [Drosophila ficusphila]|uniref:zinc finger protein 93 isoform X1 n=1 Tax=Drosophila ficusphila TaxID=30025 RepID=UPI0007E60780|nr:zinc finger protein 93 isoform X1 [Drosophila ficusphila]XP_017060382.1 zinc finger protein 93 isoform X1 [Drosophila ficusphila]XP_017060389.1 zinc finger protein 93 isoform X1 [Drosophila ficusphila]